MSAGQKEESTSREARHEKRSSPVTHAKEDEELGFLSCHNVWRKEEEKYLPLLESSGVRRRRGSGLRCVGSDSGVGGGSLLQLGAGGGATGEGGTMIIDQGFTRPVMYSQPLVESVAHYERHVFLCYKDLESRPARVEAADFDRLPRYFVAAFCACKNDMPRKTKLTICEGRDNTDSSSGDILIFQEMGLDALRRRFVCRRCAQISGRDRCQTTRGSGLCSHIGGHKYAGNVIIFSRSGSDQVSGHCYGYVVPEDVAVLLDQHIGQGEIMERLWRGQMGLVEEDQKILREQRLRCQKEGVNGCACAERQVEGRDGEGGSAGTCCRMLGSDKAASEGVSFPDGANRERFEEPESPRMEITISSKASAPETRPVEGPTRYADR
ncbi:hypothetical protein R1flu_019380 [Riccia fluitans]|uniref:Uncharacterized protein n=1 Tax=Riccia fluitans TaxID=41844 RepID=A0ABD1ZIU3_9MARC